MYLTQNELFCVNLAKNKVIDSDGKALKFQKAVLFKVSYIKTCRGNIFGKSVVSQVVEDFKA